MKKTILTLLIILSPVFAFAGFYTNSESTKSINSSEKNDRYQQVFDVVEKMPSFPGGNQALIVYLTNNIKYPIAAELKGIQGCVKVFFFVEEDGSITNASVDKPIDPSLDQEALRVISSMPKWSPAKSHGKNVRIRLSIPVTFKLNSGNKNNNSDDNSGKLVEEMPSFPGGKQALVSYLSRNIIYPVSAEIKGVQGRVLVNFIVENNGSITNASIKESVDPSLDREALRVVKSMPKWNPGKINGQAVRVCYTIPITFSLNSGNMSNSSNDNNDKPVEQFPSYPGGNEALESYLSKNMKYPTETEDKNVEGCVTVTFLVQKDGSVNNAFVIKSVSPYWDNEALRLINNMPKWIPAKSNGKNVSVLYNVPVKFKRQ